MRINIVSRLGAASFLLAASAGMALADVVYVDAAGNGDYLQLQPAIDVAADGTVILVRSGSYAGFTIDNRRLLIIEDAGATAKIVGTVTIRNTTASGLVLLAGLEISAPNGMLPGATSLAVSACAGHVRVQDCVLHGGEGATSFPAGGAGGKAADILNSVRVSFSSSNLRGGNGYGFVVFGPDGGPGGAALETRGSALALYDCTLQGGAGGDADYAVPTSAGRGGDSARVLDFGLLASGCSFKGGNGGGTSFTPGDGGHGLFVAAGAQAQLIDNTYVGGLGGWGYGGGFGVTGQPQSGGGSFHALGGVRRRFHANVLAAENGTFSIDVAGEQGDRVWLMSSGKPGYAYMPSLAGIALIPFPTFLTLRPLGTLSASGSGSFSVRTPTLNGAVDVQRSFLQGLVQSAAGVQLLGSPMHLVTLNCSALLPDCNANAECDSCDLLRSVSTDCDANGIPDECESDCNTNGIADACDITAGTSLDQNHNGVPDECEPQTTWYVDDSAPAGGNGSAAAPFQVLAQPFGLAISGDTILVADGVYKGPQNRDLNFGGRELVVRSLGGQVNCTIDCDGSGRAFRIDAGTSSASRVDGFAIINGNKTTSQDSAGGAIFMQHTSAAIADCRFVNNWASSGGGAIFIDHGSPEIRGCSFVANLTWGNGGALSLGSNEGAGIVDCAFVSNTAGRGGAIDASYGNALATWMRIERCAFLDNSGTIRGGALHVQSMPLQLDQCLMAGNRSAQGGALFEYRCDLRLIQCTLVDNQASSAAGAMYMDSGSGNPVARIVRNSIFWGNTSPSGAQFEARFGLLDVDSCSIQNSAAAMLVLAPATLIYGAHNQVASPKFVDPDGADNNVATVGDNDYRLSPASPCIDAGENAEVELDCFDLDGDGIINEFVPFDFDGATRMVDVPLAPDTGLGTAPLVDLGAWERQP